VATNCPNCAQPIADAEDDLGGWRSFLTCDRCGATLRRRGDDGAGGRPGLVRYLPPALRLGDERRGIVIDHVGDGFAGAPQAATVAERPAQRRRTGGRYGLHGLAALAIGASVLGAAVILGAPIVSALPLIRSMAGLPAPHDALAIRAVESRSIRILGENGLVVSGEIVNPTGAELALPPVRVSLETESGREVYAWTVTPARDRVAAGGTIGIRSILGKAPEGAARVSLSFAPAGGAR
jgi:hypothetical protein